MRNIVASLGKLQELELTLAEAEILLLHSQDKQTQLKQHRDKIAAVRKTLDVDQLRRYDQLRKSGLGVAREAGGICSACNLTVPVGDLNRMRRDQMAPKCPHCARFLLLSA